MSSVILMNFVFKNISKTFAIFRICLFMLFLIFGFSYAEEVNIKEKNPLELMLLKDYDGRDVSGYFISEKLDGIRAYWDGKRFLSRGGNVLNAPKEFIDSMPQFELDGELYTDRGDFENIVSLIKKEDSSWEGVRYFVFDVPRESGDLLERLEVLEKFLLIKSNANIKIIKQIKIIDNAHLKRFFDSIVEDGGEGVVIRDGGYVAGRSDGAFKMKPRYDSECMVVGYREGKGRNRGRIGSIECDDEGVRFYVGSGLSDSLRENPPKIGEVITYRYISKSRNNKPKSASFLRIKVQE